MLHKMAKLGWLVSVLLIGGLWAQSNRASITGTVMDTSGAVVAGAAVTATNVDTGVPTKTVSNQDGIYVVPNLPPGRYSVEFKRDGFKTLQRPAITLESTKVARIDAQLAVGAVSQSMTVTADAPVLDLERPTIGTNMKSSVVNDLPLSIYGGGRSIEDFAVALTPGYSPYSGPYTSVINGGQYFTKEYTVDGTSGTANIQGDSGETGPNAEAVEELQAQTSGLDAQSAVTGGGVIQFNLKSGTNKFHGSTFLYGVNELLNANTWTNDYLGLGKSKKRAWDYGFSVGGPIFKDKTFFFGAFERFQHTNFGLNSGSISVPTPAFLNGDFRELLGGNLCNGDVGIGLCDNYKPGNNPFPLMVVDSNGQSLQARLGMIYDWYTTDNPSCPAEQYPCQFADNTIPANRISPVSQKVIAFYKDYAPQLGGLDNNARGLIDNGPSQTPNQFVVKVDHVLREQDRLSGSWIYNHRPRTLVDGGGVWQAGTETGGPLSNARYQTYWAHQIRLSESHTFTPQLLNVANFTTNWDFNSSRPSNPGNWNEQLGFGNNGANTFPVIGFDEQYSAVGHGETYLGNAWQGKLTGATTIVGDTLTWTKGRHNLSFGGDFKAHQINNTTGSGALSFDFKWYTTSGRSAYDGFSFASFLLGQVQGGASESVAHNQYGRQKGIFLYAQDNYKVTSKLTLSMGLRWNFNFRFHEKYGNWANYDLNAIDPNYGYPGKLVFAKNGDDSFFKNQYYRQFGPSLGFAYQMHPKTVVRGSFGLIFNPVGVTFFGGVPDGFAPQLGVNTVGGSPGFSWDGPGGTGNYPGQVVKADASTDPNSIFPEVAVDPRALRLGYSEAFNFGIQQELTRSTRLEISYVGNRGHRLTDTALAWNEGPTKEFLRLVNMAKTKPDYYSGQITPLTRYEHWVCDAGAAAYYGVPYPTTTGYTYGNFCGSVLALLAPSPQMADRAANYWGYYNINYVGLPLAQSFYDSMVVNLVKKTGLVTTDMSYTWGRQEGNSYTAQQDYNGYYTGVQDFQNIRQSAHAVTGYDLTHIVKGFVRLDLPFGKGRPYLANQGRLLNAIIGGWTVSGLVSYHTGQPFRVGAPRGGDYWPLWGGIYPEFNLDGYRGPNGTKGFVPLPPGYTGPLPEGNRYMPKSVASNPDPGVLPTHPNTSALRCASEANENVSLMKDFRAGSDGQYRLSFRTEFYNVFNRHYYFINGCYGTQASVGSDGFGQIYGVNDNPRGGQFAVRFEF